MKMTTLRKILFLAAGIVASVSLLCPQLFLDRPLRPRLPGCTASLASGQVAVNWTDNSNNETGFIIERSPGRGRPRTRFLIRQSEP